MVRELWSDIASRKRFEVAQRVPSEWKLSPETLAMVDPGADANVMDIPRTCGLLTDKELQITEKHDATGLIAKMASKELSSAEVTLAFCKRAAIAHQLTNCLTEIFFDQALDRAKYLDEYLAKEGKPMGPLHGMPVSLKDSWNVNGVQSTIGYIAYVDRPAAELSSPLVDILLQNGAVLYVKTNIPQTLMTTDSENNVFGRTLNPRKLKLQAGGSSGGEGALVSMRGSVLGVGTDIGGSIRIPAFCCGVYGFKPSVGRIPFGGQTNPVPDGWTGVMPMAGPLAHSARDLRLFLESTIKSEPWNKDHTALAIPWHPVSRKQALTIGVLFECPSWPLHPPMMRAMRTAVETLKKARHTLVPLPKFPSFKEAADLTMDFFDIDNSGYAMQPIMDAEEPFVRSVIDLYSPPPEGRRKRELEELIQMNGRQLDFRRQWLQIFRENGLDVLLAPGSHKTAQPHDTYRLPPYTMMWNLLAYPACVIPFLKADQSIDLVDTRVPEYDPQMVHGLPCTVQVVARAEQDEELMVAVEIISEALQAQA